jgi:hypothetical protein
MSRFNVTAAATAQFRDMIARDQHARDVVVLVWEERKVDNLRAPNGEVQWVREAKGRLLFDLASEQELVGRRETIQIANGLKFFVPERIHKNRLDGHTIDFTEDGFTVE